jgi:hypothetical protein
MSMHTRIGTVNDNEGEKGKTLRVKEKRMKRNVKIKPKQTKVVPPTNEAVN